ncbi:MULTISPECIES: hypothetical protein [unclassified Shewanella]|uniref:hypothetical protein n=1 Tax=unclassified Shewanella TaxID=196818 RepID=UPI001BBE80EF|nr:MULTISPECIES: hypothetical protein [unclassified Shewanella]GIU05931.1 hypothetical protein TUM4444_03060 [Shewanella sp. MBTL60-112-B1]GIU25663.1 hypothetical protein TUM4445_04060 [Shewanella sp. MBTL60-112-B2]
MRIRFNVGLEPELFDSHSYAIKCLRLWQQEEKSRNDETDTVLQRRIQFHRDLYLSGLFLHELAPQLPSMLTQTLLQDKVNSQTLAYQIKSAGLSLEPATENGLSEQQWQKLSSMLETASLANSQSELANLTAIEQQLAQLQQLMLEGQEQLSSVLTHSATNQAEARNKGARNKEKSQTEVSSETVQQQPDFSAQLSQLKQGQEKLMAQMKSLSSQLAQVSGTSLANHSANDASNQETPSLETQLERARRVKSKGLW